MDYLEDFSLNYIVNKVFSVIINFKPIKFNI